MFYSFPDLPHNLKRWTKNRRAKLKQRKAKREREREGNQISAMCYSECWVILVFIFLFVFDSGFCFVRLQGLHLCLKSKGKQQQQKNGSGSAPICYYIHRECGETAEIIQQNVVECTRVAAVANNSSQAHEHQPTIANNQQLQCDFSDAGPR